MIKRLADPNVRLITTDKKFKAEKAGENERTESDQEDDGGLEVAHEALIRGWKKFQEWVDADREGIRTRRRLTEAASEWSMSPLESRDEYLYTGAWLAVANRWAEGKQLGPIEREFLSASLEAERQRREKEIEEAKRLEAERARHAEQLAEQQHRLGRRFLVVAGVAFLMAVTAGGFYLRANSARENAEEAGNYAVSQANGPSGPLAWPGRSLTRCTRRSPASSKRPAHGRISAHILEKAGSFYELEALPQGDDPETRLAAARTQNRLAYIECKLGRLDEARRWPDERLRSLSRSQTMTARVRG